MSAEQDRDRLARFLSAAFRWIDSTGFDTPKATHALAAAINEIRYTDHERTPAEIVASLAKPPAEPAE